MTPGAIISVVINFAVGIYFIHYFPRSLKRKISTEVMPLFFRIMQTVIPLLGYLLIGATLVYLVIGPEVLNPLMDK